MKSEWLVGFGSFEVVEVYPHLPSRTFAAAPRGALATDHLLISGIGVPLPCSHGAVSP